MAWGTTKGFNVRSTSGFVTDPANTTYVTSAETYPTTRSIGGENVTFGWGTGSSYGIEFRDRNDAIDARIAGLAFITSAAYNNFLRVNVPAAGDYKVTLALGDPEYGHNTQVLIKDGVDGATLATIQDSSIAGGHWVDAGGTERTSASDWVTNGQGTITVTLSGTVFCAYLVQDGTYTDVAFAHLKLEQVGGGPSATYGRRFGGTLGVGLGLSRGMGGRLIR